jgi:hypothetical protein
MKPMRPLIAISCLAALLTLGACGPKLPSGVNGQALDDGVAEAIGSPSTCVLAAEKASGKLVYRYGSHEVCARSINACDRPGTTTAQTELNAARSTGAVRTASCETAEEASRGVAWASGPLPALPGKADRQMVYSAFMEGPEALSGREAKRRLENAFAKVGF